MPLKSHSILVIMLFLLGFTSCRKKEFSCAKAFIVPTFVGKNVNDLSNFRLYRYEKNSNMAILIDSVNIENSLVLVYQQDGDMLRLFAYNMDLPFETKYDYKFRFFNTTVDAGKSIISIHEMLEQDNNMKCKIDKSGGYGDDCYCMNELLSCKVENTTLSQFAFVKNNEVSYWKGYQVVINP